MYIITKNKDLPVVYLHKNRVVMNTAMQVIKNIYPASIYSFKINKR